MESCINMTDAIQNALKKLRRLVDEASADEEKYYHLGATEAADLFKDRKLCYKIALQALEEEIK